MRQITLLKSKIHNAIVNESDYEYEGSCSISKNLADLANIREYEQIHIYNITNGNRFTTYAIIDKARDNYIAVYGAAAKLAFLGDRIIITAYAQINEFSDSKVNRVILDGISNKVI